MLNQQNSTVTQNRYKITTRFSITLFQKIDHAQCAYLIFLHNKKPDVSLKNGIDDTVHLH